MEILLFDYKNKQQNEQHESIYFISEFQRMCGIYV